MHNPSPYKFALRIPEEIKDNCLNLAAKNRLSLNQWIVQAIEDKIKNELSKSML